MYFFSTVTLTISSYCNPQNLAVSAGASKEDFEKVRKIIERIPAISYICLDVANGYSQMFVDCVASFRDQFPDKTIMAGNVVTHEMVEELILGGADIIKVGIGPGSVCTTRKKTGVGYPQLSAVIECADAAHGLGGHVISDGRFSIVYPGVILDDQPEAQRLQNHCLRLVEK